ncbi:MAG: hypothetical protein NT062_04515 [Proteobacteria bacterium]|nr:hypothetical protein [Pseudomonadota bacterium]
MRALLLVALLVDVSACNAAEDGPTAPGKPGKLVYDTPDEWTSHETTTRESVTTVWTPPTKNDAKESITVVRARAHLRPTDFNEAFVAQLLVDAQQALPGATLTTRASKITTPDGLEGAQLEVDFTPRDQPKRYHRIHAVLLDGEDLVHVLYTSATASSSREAFTVREQFP